MKVTAADKRKNLFNLYSTNLSYLIESGYLRYKDGQFIELDNKRVLCPLCMHFFGEDSLNPLVRNPLTIEHVPPESAGGKGKILTCKICNQVVGGKLDHHIQKCLNVEPILNGHSNATVEGRITINKSIPFKTTFTFDDGKFSFSPFLDKRTKSHQDNALHELKNNWDGSQIDIQFKGGNQRKFNLALLKSAYLEMYSFFGHAFLFNTTSEEIRKQINQSGEELLTSIPIIDSMFDDRFLGVNIVKHHSANICFLVVMNLKIKINNNSKKIGVLFPNPSSNGWESLKKLKPEELKDLALRNLSNYNCIRNKELAMSYYTIWGDINNNDFESFDKHI